MLVRLDIVEVCAVTFIKTIMAVKLELSFNNRVDRAINVKTVIVVLVDNNILATDELVTVVFVESVKRSAKIFDSKFVYGYDHAVDAKFVAVVGVALEVNVTAYLIGVILNTRSLKVWACTRVVRVVTADASRVGLFIKRKTSLVVDKTDGFIIPLGALSINNTSIGVKRVLAKDETFGNFAAGLFPVKGTVTKETFA
jgi:hypothetical protein